MARLRHKAAIIAVFALACSMLVTAPLASAQSSPGLADLAPNRLAVGGVLHSYDPTWDDGLYASTAASEFNAVTATAYMPWGPHPTQNQIDTRPLDNLVDWAQSNDLRVHGHTLLYPFANESLDWYQALDGGHRAVLENYIRTIASSNAGDIWVWDVVNEAFADPGETADGRGLRTSYIEYDALGGRYDDAFIWAHESDPDAQLIINDYGAEEWNDKSTALFNEVIAMRDRGVPIDGVGFQMHLDDDPDFWSIRQNLQRFADAGFDLYITELDVSIVQRSSGAQSLTAEQRQLQRAIYEEVTRVALEQPAVKSLLLWDFADERSWLHPTRVPLGDIPIGTYLYPTPFRESAVGEPLTPKAGYQGMVDAFFDYSDPEISRTGERHILGFDESQARYLGRSGDGASPESPIDTTWLGSLTPQRQDWLSLRWNIEPAGEGWFRISSSWEGADGYLTRVGSPNDSGGFDPTNQVGLERLNNDWPSQLWRIERTATNRYRIVNMWEPHTGALTRNGDGVVLDQAGPPWKAQRWRLRQT